MVETVKGRVLVIDDDAAVRTYYQKKLEAEGFVADVAADLGEMRSRINSVSYDLTLLDLNLGPENGFDGLNILLKEAPFTKTYVLTSHGSIQRAVEAMQRGASGFFEKGTEFAQLLGTLAAAMAPRVVGDSDFADIGLIGKSPALQEVIEKLKRLRDVDSMVLLLGESGTGKEVIARAIHRLSRRSGQRFDAINCGAIPEMLLESELFGHKRGAFTDAKADRKGIFELCSEGTLLLDEIGDMPLPLQMKLLRVLQEKEVTPIGSATPVKINTRVIAATHRNILEEARAKRFREDLYFRLSIIVIHVPPLRERREDIPLLVEHFLDAFNRRFDRHVNPPTPTAMSRLAAYDWPGNVRELQNAIERAVVLAQGDEIDVKDVFSHLMLDKHPPAMAADTLHAIESDVLFDMSLTDAKRAFEKIYLEHQLKRFKGHVTHVANKAGRYRADVYRLLSRYGIDHGGYRAEAAQ